MWHAYCNTWFPLNNQIGQFDVLGKNNLKLGGNMKTFFIVTLSIAIACVFSSNAFSSDKFEDIYGGKVNQMISFYQARLYLADSEYTILSDIGKDAALMINYLEANKGRLVGEMRGKQMHTSGKIRRYITNHARMYVMNNEVMKDVGLGYTKP